MNIALSGKLALVTGASGGIGQGIAKALGRSGAAVAVNFLSNEQGAAATVAAIEADGGKAAAFRADVTKPEEIERMLADIRETLGGSPDIVVNNAGHLVQRLANADMTEELYAKIMDVNLKSTVFVSKAVIPGMREKGGGRIVNMTSIAAHNGGGPGATIYAASKAAVLTYTKGLAKEVAGDGILVNALSPGFIGGTAFHDTFTPAEARQAAVKGIPLGREGTPQDVAGAALFLVSELGGYLTGETIEINGGMFMR